MIRICPSYELLDVTISPFVEDDQHLSFELSADLLPPENEWYVEIYDWWIDTFSIDGNVVKLCSPAYLAIESYLYNNCRTEVEEAIINEYYMNGSYSEEDY